MGFDLLRGLNTVLTVLGCGLFLLGAATGAVGLLWLGFAVGVVLAGAVTLLSPE